MTLDSHVVILNIITDVSSTIVLSFSNLCYHCIGMYLQNVMCIVRNVNKYTWSSSTLSSCVKTYRSPL